MQETQGTKVGSLYWEDPLEEEMATLYSILAWKIPWMEKPVGLWFIVSQRVGHNCSADRVAVRFLAAIQNSE